MSEEEKINGENNYSASNIQVLEGLEAVRKRPAMYIGDISEKGLHHLVYEVVDNSIDEALAGYCDHIEVTINEDNSITVQDNGRGIPVDFHEKEKKSALEVVMTVLHAGGKFDKGSYKVSGGLHGVGVSCVNALSTHMTTQVFRGGKIYQQEYSCGHPLYSVKEVGTADITGTKQTFWPDDTIFTVTEYKFDILQARMRELAYLNKGITISLTDRRIKEEDGSFKKEIFHSDEGVKEFVRFLNRNNEALINDVIYLNTEKNNTPIECAIMYNTGYRESLHSYVNNINTIEGGTHEAGFRSALTRVLKKYAEDTKALEKAKVEISGEDFREGLIAVISVKVAEPQFEGQPKTKLGSNYMWVKQEKDEQGNAVITQGPTIRSFINDFISRNLDNYLTIHKEIVPVIEEKIKDSKKEREEISGIQKKTREKNKRANVYNKKLRDCRYHYCDKLPKDKIEEGEKSSIFITEGDSASGTITKVRNANNQAVFSLRGKPINCYKESRKKVAENEELNLLISALGVEDDLKNLRYNNIIVATDADDDGMHIRMLVLTFFMKYYPELIRRGHVYILQTPLFRVRNKKETRYCYNDDERANAIKELKNGVEITRFKGLGEISPDEFVDFIGDGMRLDAVNLAKDESISNIMEFYMGDNTIDRQNFIRQNLRSEEELEDIKL